MNTEDMASTTAKRRHTSSPVARAWNLAKDMDDSQKLELVSIIIDSMRPAVAKGEVTDDEEYPLRPFTMEELNARIDQAEANFEAGLGIPDEEAWDDLEEEFAD